MTFKVNIEHGVCGADSTSLYTTGELISYGLSGCLYAGDTDLTAFVEQIVTHYETKCLAHETDINDLEDDAYSRGRRDAISEMMGCLENL